jgi:hypothetical protein
LIQKQTPSYELQIFFGTSVLGVGLLEVISGFSLVISVYKIRAFFKKHDAEDMIEGKIMLLHVSAFGIYLLSVLIFYSISAFHFVGIVGSELYEISTLFYVIVSFVTAILFAIIFWDIGRKEEEPLDTEMGSVIV